MSHFHALSLNAFTLGYNPWPLGVLVDFLHESIDETFDATAFSVPRKMFSKPFFFILVGPLEFLSGLIFS